MSRNRVHSLDGLAPWKVRFQIFALGGRRRVVGVVGTYEGLVGSNSVLDCSPAAKFSLTTLTFSLKTLGIARGVAALSAKLSACKSQAN